jgi:hypothetical protein
VRILVRLLKAGSGAPDIHGMSNTKIHRARTATKTRSAAGRKKQWASTKADGMVNRMRTVVGPVTLKEIGVRTGTHPENARRYMSAGLPGEGLRFLRAFCKTYNVSADWVLEGKGSKTRRA